MCSPPAEPGRPPADRIEAVVAALAALGADVAPPAVAATLRYLDLMLERNRQLNLTAVRDPAAAEVLHAIDSLALARLDLRPHRALDLGSGNGFPGVAVAALHPLATVELLDRTAKKVRAVADLVAAAGLANARARLGDAAQLPAREPRLRRAFDLIVARAVGRPDEVARLAAPLLAPGGSLVLWLDADTELPARPAPRLRRQREVVYALPEPAARVRRLGVCTTSG